MSNTIFQGEDGGGGAASLRPGRGRASGRNRRAPGRGHLRRGARMKRGEAGMRHWRGRCIRLRHHAPLRPPHALSRFTRGHGLSPRLLVGGTLDALSPRVAPDRLRVSHVHTDDNRGRGDRGRALARPSASGEAEAGAFVDAPREGAPGRPPVHRRWRRLRYRSPERPQRAGRRRQRSGRAGPPHAAGRGAGCRRPRRVSRERRRREGARS